MSRKVWTDVFEAEIYMRQLYIVRGQQIVIWNWKKMAGSGWTRFHVRVPGTLDYPVLNLNPR